MLENAKKNCFMRRNKLNNNESLQNYKKKEMLYIQNNIN